MHTVELKVLLWDAIEAAVAAGKEILEVYEGAFEVTYKDDHSPLTLADQKAHQCIVRRLRNTGIPILSEEGKALAYDERNRWSQLWIVDPLDGTKEFVKQNGEFTVNIALVEQQKPVLGVIYIPVEDTLYFAYQQGGSYRIEHLGKIDVEGDIEALLNKATTLPEAIDRPYTMVGSRSHMSKETTHFFEQVREKHPDAQIVSKGSSLKICMVAEGSADVYPRFAPTMEWDTAAGHAIALEAGFEVVQPQGGSALVYNKENLLNPWFIVRKPISNEPKG